MRRMTTYFAFGSNLDQAQMRRRCPSAVLVGNAMLHGWRLRFAGWSSGWGGAVADITRDASATTPGAIYHLPLEELHVLDAYEGVPVSYQRARMRVTVPGATARRAWVYRMAGSSEAAPPSDRYLAAIWRGYRACGLDHAVLLDAARAAGWHGNTAERLKLGQTGAARKAGSARLRKVAKPLLCRQQYAKE